MEMSLFSFNNSLLLYKDEEPFNSDYIEVDRILDESHSVDKENGEVSTFWSSKKCFCLHLVLDRIYEISLLLFCYSRWCTT